MARYLGDTVTLDFTTTNPYSGMVQNADVIPTCQVFEDDTDLPILSPVVVSRGLIGNYRVSFEASEANGFEEGGSYNVVVEATVEVVTAKSRISAFGLSRAQVETGSGFRI